MLASDKIDYQLKCHLERIGALELTIESLADLDRTIDLLFVRLKETGNERLLEDLCPYFGVIWPSARALSEHLAALPPDALTGRRLLELGCGLALPSLAAARLGARVTATDFHPEVPWFLARNLRLNAIPELEYLGLDWRRSGLGAVPPFDWIVGSDILYESYQPALVARVIRAHLAPGGSALVADPGRPYLQGFVDEMKRAGFESRLIPRGNIFLLEFREGPNVDSPHPRPSRDILSHSHL